MKVWYDTEFVERGPQLPIQLVSIGMVREDGDTLYLINADCLSNVARHPWLSVNVMPHLPAKGAVNEILEWDREHEDFDRVLTFDAIGPIVLEFLRDAPDLELWGYYSAYDHVALCQLFGSMADLPAGIPMYTNDLMQEWSRLGAPDVRAPQYDEHHALSDAIWTKDLHERLEAWHLAPGPLEIEQEEREDNGDS
jgi:hypothetical protein